MDMRVTTAVTRITLSDSQMKWNYVELLDGPIQICAKRNWNVSTRFTSIYCINWHIFHFTLPQMRSRIFGELTSQTYIYSTRSRASWKFENFSCVGPMELHMQSNLIEVEKIEAKCPALDECITVKWANVCVCIRYSWTRDQLRHSFLHRVDALIEWFTPSTSIELINILQFTWLSALCRSTRNHCKNRAAKEPSKNQ